MAAAPQQARQIPLLRVYGCPRRRAKAPLQRVLLGRSETAARQFIRCIMSSTIRNQTPLSRVGSLVFARQTPYVAAERHASLLTKLRDWRARRAAAAELSSLSDRSLADIGLTRDDIPTVVGS